MVEFASRCLGQYNTRHYLVPPANGVDYRVHNGYNYMSPIAVPEDEIGARIPQFLERAGHYYANWPTLLENWHVKMHQVIADLEAIDFQPLPEVVPLEWIIEGRGLDNTFDLTQVVQPPDRALLPGVAVPLRVPQPRVRGLPRLLRVLQGGLPGDLGSRHRQDGAGRRGRPLPAGRRAARACQARGRARASRTRSRPATSTRRSPPSAPCPKGDQWLAAWEAAKDPWFNFSSGNGFYSSDRVWLDHLEIPLGFLRDYVRRVKAGEDIDRPTAAIAAERDRITTEYRALLADDELRAAFDEKLGLSRLVFPYVENHNFYVEHWALSVFWRKIRALGQILADAGFWPDGGRHLLRSPRRAPAGRSTTTATAGAPARRRSGRRTGRPRSSAGAASSPPWSARRRRRR